MGSNNEQGIKDRIKARLLEATSEDDLKRIRQELKEQGEKPGSIDACVSELRKKGHLKFNGGTKTSGQAGVVAVRKESESVLPEWVARDVSEIFDGDAKSQRIFMAGLATPILGMRLFSEAVKPLVALLSTWQRGQAEAARAAQGDVIEAAKAAGQAGAMGVAAYFEEKKPWLATAPNPLLAMMTDTMQPFFQQALGGLMGTLMRPSPGGQAGAQQPPGAKPQVPPGVTEMSSEEEKEVFGE